MTSFALNSALPTIYPSRINRACAILDEIDAFRDIPDGHLRVLIRLVKKINLRALRSPIIVTRETLSRECGRSVETVQRAIRWLEDQGLITRSQRAGPGLKGSKSPIVPTADLIHLLRLDDDSCKEGYPQPPGVTNDASISTKEKTVSKKEQPSRERVRVGRYVLPGELAWICKKGVNPTAVLLLMKLAKQAGQRLSDVVAATASYLDKLSGKNLFAYLRRLVTLGKDYAYLARRQGEERRQAVDLGKIEEARRMLVGQRFTSRRSGVIIYVDRGGMLAIEKDGTHLGYRPMDVEFVDALASGILTKVCV